MRPAGCPRSCRIRRTYRYSWWMCQPSLPSLHRPTIPLNQFARKTSLHILPTALVAALTGALDTPQQHRKPTLASSRDRHQTRQAGWHKTLPLHGLHTNKLATWIAGAQATTTPHARKLHQSSIMGRVRATTVWAGSTAVSGTCPTTLLALLETEVKVGLSLRNPLSSGSHLSLAVMRLVVVV